MEQSLRFRARRQVTHHYLSDLIELDPAELASFGAPTQPAAFLEWMAEQGSTLSQQASLNPAIHDQLRRLNFFQEDRDQRLDQTLYELI
jgi:hypothetical protein